MNPDLTKDCDLACRKIVMFSANESKKNDFHPDLLFSAVREEKQKRKIPYAALVWIEKEQKMLVEFGLTDLQKNYSALHLTPTQAESTKPSFSKSEDVPGIFRKAL